MYSFVNWLIRSGVLSSRAPVGWAPYIPRLGLRIDYIRVLFVTGYMLRLDSQEAIYDNSLLKLPSSGIDGLCGYKRDYRKEPSYHYIYRT